MRQDAQEGQRPKLGRKTKTKATTNSVSTSSEGSKSSSTSSANSSSSDSSQLRQQPECVYSGQSRGDPTQATARGVSTRATAGGDSTQATARGVTTQATARVSPSSSSQFETLSGNKPHPEYLKKGPIVTQQMFDDANWPEILNIPDSTRPTRSTRNPNPVYKWNTRRMNPMLPENSSASDC